MASGRHRRVALPGVAAVTVAMLGAGAMVWHGSYAAFSATAVNSGNTWTVGSVTIGSDRGSTAVFNIPAAKPDTAANLITLPGTGAFSPAGGATSGGSTCVKVTYTGTMTANVKLYATLSDTGLGQYLLMSIDSGTDTAPASDATCATYTSTANVYGPSPNSANKSNGLPTTYAAAPALWSNVAQNAVRWYRISWLLPANVPNAAQGLGVQITYTWEAQNT
jgi:hypothetical protein